MAVIIAIITMACLAGVAIWLYVKVQPKMHNRAENWARRRWLDEII